MDTDEFAAALTAFQIEVARLFFSLPSAQGFVLTGGAALVAQHLSAPPTHDLDFLTSRGGDVPVARDDFESAAMARGWTVARIRDEPQFCRLQVHGAEDPARRPPGGRAAEPAQRRQCAGPDARAGGSGRSQAACPVRPRRRRDFVDVYVLAQRYGRDLLTDRAAAVDLGFDRAQLAAMMAMLVRYTDEDLPLPADQVPALRAYFRDWRSMLTASSDDEGNGRPAR